MEFRNLKPKIILSLLVIVVAVLFVSELFHYSETKKSLSIELESLADQKITRMKQEYVFPLWEVDGNWVQQDINTEMMDKRLYAIAVRGEGGILVGAMRNKQWQVVVATEAIAGDFITRESDIVYKDEKIGSIKIYITKRFMRESLTYQVRRALLTTISLSVLMLIFMTIMFNKIIVNPIRSMLDTTTAIADGDYSHHLQIEQKDEVGLLAAGINRMLDNIRLREEERDRAESELTVKKAALEQVNKELYEHRAHLEEEVAERTDELNKANQQLQELDKLKSMFIASMSHELRTPLNSIIGFTGITLEGITGEINETQRDQLQRVYRAAKHLLSLINDVIDISKVEAGRTDVFPSQFTLQEIVDEAVGNIQPMAERKSLFLHLQIPEATVFLFTDRQRLLQCLINLMSNAVKFTENGGITITASETDDAVKITVSDTGIGIKDADLPRLFEAFERLESHMRIKAGGTGLGLYLTNKICTTLLHGSVSVESVPDQGSSFTLQLPKRLEAHDVQA